MQINEYTRGYCDAFKHLSRVVQLRAQEMNDPGAKAAMNVLANDLGRIGADFKLDAKATTLRKLGFR